VASCEGTVTEIELEVGLEPSRVWSGMTYPRSLWEKLLKGVTPPPIMAGTEIEETAQAALILREARVAPVPVATSYDMRPITQFASLAPVVDFDHVEAGSDAGLQLLRLRGFAPEGWVVTRWVIPTDRGETYQ
jgi:hypothetical protein